MRLESDLEMQAWITNFLAVPDNFDWDSGNINKNLKHHVRQDEIESIFYQPDLVFAGSIVVPIHSEWRGLILGTDKNNRLLSLVFTRRGEKLRPISCRRIRKQEVKIYHEKTKS